MTSQIRQISRFVCLGLVGGVMVGCASSQKNTGVTEFAESAVLTISAMGINADGVVPAAPYSQEARQMGTAASMVAARQQEPVIGLRTIAVQQAARPAAVIWDKPPPAPVLPTVKPSAPVMTTVTVEREVSIGDSLFAFDKATLNVKQAGKLLDEIVESGKAGKTIRIAGHTDAIGADEYNDKLSLRRANAVRAYLVQRGVSDAQIEIEALGKRQPKADNSTEGGRAKNRRAEVSVVIVEAVEQPIGAAPGMAKER